MPFSSVTNFVLGLAAIIVALTFHEYAHAKVSYLLGDPTAKHQGRLTLNPLKHMDPLGTLLLVTAGFGWARPVQVNTYYLKGDRRRSMMLVGLAGPLMNLVLAYLAAVLFQVLYRQAGYWPVFLIFLQLTTFYNVVLAVFNLIPIPPLDGSRVLAGLLPRESANTLYQLEAYGPILLLILIVTGLTDRILSPIVRLLLNLIGALSGTILL